MLLDLIGATEAQPLIWYDFNGNLPLTGKVRDKMGNDPDLGIYGMME